MCIRDRLSIGYGFVQAAMLGDLAGGNFTATVIAILLAAVALRMVMTSFVVGSGGSAGLFGTSVVVGAFLGTALGGVFHELVPGLVPLSVVAVFSVVGMMSFFGGISKAPLGVLIMVVEMAGTYTVLPAAMVSIFVAYVVTGRSRIYSEQVPTRLQSPAHREEYRNYFLTETSIGEVAAEDSEAVPPSLRVREALDLATGHGRAILSVEDGGHWIGAAYLSDLLEVPPDRREEMRVIELVRPVELTVSSDLTVREALARMDETGTQVAAVISAEPPIRVLGVVTRRVLRSPSLDAAARALD